MSNTPTPFNLVESLGKFLAITGGLGLAASLIYDWGFYYALGLTFMDVPSQISDHARSALDWLPKITVTIVPVFVFEMLTQRIEQGMSEEEIVNSTKNPEHTRKFRDRPWIFIFYVSLFGCVAYLLFGNRYIAQLELIRFSLCVTWIGFGLWVQRHPRIINRRPYIVRLAVTFLPALGIWLFFSGYIQAANFYDKAARTSQLTNSSGEVESIVVIRQLEKGVLIRKTNSTLSFKPWEEIKMLDTVGSYSPYRGVICSWFQVACKSE